MDKKLLKMEKKIAAASGLQVSAAAPYSSHNPDLDSQPHPGFQIAGGVKKTAADKQLQRDAKAIVKKSMVHAQPLAFAGFFLKC
jgi:hypothetical protein